MLLVFIGSVFIIGKLREPITKAELGTEAWKASILSASPGVTMALLGALLIGVGLFVQPPIDFPDHPVYWVRAEYGKSGNGPQSESQGTVPVPVILRPLPV